MTFPTFLALLALTGCGTTTPKPATSDAPQGTAVVAVTAPAAPAAAAAAPAPRTLPPRHNYTGPFYDRLGVELAPSAALVACPRDVTADKAASCSALQTWNADAIYVRDGLKALHAPTH